MPVGVAPELRGGGLPVSLQDGGARTHRDPHPHPSGARPPVLPPELVPQHVAIVMDGNGRWAQLRGLPRTKGHEAGEDALFDCVEGAIELGIRWMSVYAFSTENWKRAPDEVAFLMRFVDGVFGRRIDDMDALGVNVRWAGRRPRLWNSVIRRLEKAEERTKNNDRLSLAMCINYGGRAEIADAAAALARDVRDGQLKPDKIDERTFARYLDEPDMPDVDLLIRTSGEQRLSNFLLWQSAYSELYFCDAYWPQFREIDFLRALRSYGARQRRFGG